jgi:glucokinase
VIKVIGIDVGGTKVAAQMLGPDGLGEHQQQPTALDSAEQLLDQFADLVALAAAGGSFDGVGIGVPSVVRSATGEVASSVNIPLEHVELRKVLGERLGVPVFVDNDATVAALAEAHDDDLKLAVHNLVMLTIGTGFGGGIVIGGRIFRGASGGGGEVGHQLIALDVQDDIPMPSGKFPQRGSLESLGSGRALDHFTQAAAAAHPDSAIGKLAAAGKTVLGADAVQAAEAGCDVARTVVRRWAHAIGIGVANAINVFDPDEVVIGGGGAAAGKILIDYATEIADGYVHPGLRGHAKIRFAHFGASAGVLGAALLARQELEHAN